MYEELIEALRLCVKYGKAEDALTNASQAADAIEKLGDWWAMADKLIKMLEMPRWIPVTERLPDVNEKVLTFARNKYDGSWFMDITSWTGVRNHDEYQFWGCGDSMKVTHWMPLPKSPKEE